MKPSYGKVNFGAERSLYTCDESPKKTGGPEDEPWMRTNVFPIIPVTCNRMARMDMVLEKKA